MTTDYTKSHQILKEELLQQLLLLKVILKNYLPKRTLTIEVNWNFTESYRKGTPTYRKNNDRYT